MLIHTFETICQEMPFKVDYVKTIFFNIPLMYEFYTSNHGVFDQFRIMLKMIVF